MYGSYIYIYIYIIDAFIVCKVYLSFLITITFREFETINILVHKHHNWNLEIGILSTGKVKERKKEKKIVNHTCRLNATK